MSSAYSLLLTFQRTNEPIAIKVVSRSKLTPKLLENLEGEISILKAISHRNIVELDDCIVGFMFVDHLSSHYILTS